MIGPLLALDDVALLLLRAMVAAVFFTSGLSHARDPVARGASIGMSPAFTRVLGVAEMAGAVGVVAGILTQFAALGLVAVMLGSIHRKIFVWRTGFWGANASGWHYDLMLVVMNLVIATTNGGRLVIW